MDRQRLQVVAAIECAISHKQQRSGQFHLLQVVAILKDPVRHLLQVRTSQVEQSQVIQVANEVEVIFVHRALHLQTLQVPRITSYTI